MTHMLEGRLKSVVEEAKMEKALKEVSKATLRDQIAALSTAEKRAIEVENTHASAEKRVAKLERKLVDIEVKLAQVESVNFVREKEVFDLKTTVEESENKFYDMGLLMSRTQVSPS